MSVDEDILYKGYTSIGKIYDELQETKRLFTNLIKVYRQQEKELEAYRKKYGYLKDKPP